MTTAKNILYPFALSETGRAVQIGEATKGSPYQCFGCSARMVAKQGGKRQWHFAHKPPLERCTDPDKALHEAAMILIAQGFSDALRRQDEYRLGCPCEVCGRVVSRNAAVQDSRVEVERSVVAGTRSDLVVFQPGRSPVIIEVVVAHDMEPESLESYEKSGYPVLKVYPTWETLADLESSVITADTLNVPAIRCAECRAAEVLRRRREEKVRTQVDSMLSRMDQRRRADPDKPPFLPWTHDQFGRPMFPRIRRQVFSNAIILTELGFIQTRSKPWLLLFRLSGGVIFANFGSTEEIAIWEDPAALIHWNLGRCSDEMESGLVKGVLARCRAAGAKVRVSFYNRMIDHENSSLENDLANKVDRTAPNTLPAAAARIYPDTERRLKQARAEQQQRMGQERREQQQRERKEQ